MMNVAWRAFIAETRAKSLFSKDQLQAGWPEEMTLHQLAEMQGGIDASAYVGEQLQWDIARGAQHSVRTHSKVVDTGLRAYQVRRNDGRLETCFWERVRPERREQVSEATMTPQQFQSWLAQQTPALFASKHAAAWFETFGLTEQAGLALPLAVASAPVTGPDAATGQPFILKRNLLVAHFESLGWAGIDNDLKTKRPSHAGLAAARTKRGCYVVCAVEKWGRENGHIPVHSGEHPRPAVRANNPFSLGGALA